MCSVRRTVGAHQMLGVHSSIYAVVILTADTLAVTNALITVLAHRNRLKNDSWYYCFHLNTATYQLCRPWPLTQVTSLGINVLDRKVRAGDGLEGTYFVLNTLLSLECSLEVFLLERLPYGNMNTWLLGTKSLWAVIQKEWRGAEHSCLASCVNL